MLVVIAEKEELKLVEELGYSEHPVLITGVGGMNVIRALKDLPRDTEILNIGYCGSNNYKIGEKLVVRSVNTYHEIADFTENRGICANFERYTPTKCFTSTDFVTKTKEKTDCVFDMELAFICAMFPNTRAIKVVSDNLNKRQYKKTTN